MYSASSVETVERERARAHRSRQEVPRTRVLPECVYLNRDTGKAYTPHHADEARAVQSDTPTYLYIKGGEGSGKSVAGSVKALERIRRGMSGILASPDLPHFRKSLWPEFKRWCPVEWVIPSHRYRLRFDWEPTQPFALAFINGTTLLCGGIEEPGSWEGPNVHFALFDEPRRHKNANALKVLAGRVRLVGPAGQPPQLVLTGTPRKHWLYEYFVGPLAPDQPDLYADFRSRAEVVTLRTRDNIGNLDAEYIANRTSTLSDAEAREVMDAEWEDLEGTERFLPSITLWDLCRQDVPPLDAHTPLVVALDAATGRSGAVSDCFGLVAVSRHWLEHGHVAIRYAEKWQAKAGEQINYLGTPEHMGPEARLKWLCSNFNVVQVCYDPHQLVDLAQRGSREGWAWFKEFKQAADRLDADKQLLDLITQRRIAQDGNPDVRQHIDNADRKLDDDGKRLRIVKRSEALKIDLAVCSSMAAARILRLNV